MYTSKTPQVLKALASDMTWNKSRDDSAVYLTFDDGPTKGVTDRILDVLKEKNAKATFFCVGEMARNSPELLLRMQSEEHSVGNHTMNHESGWKTSNFSYFKSFLKCHELVNSSLFRPPYGRISKSQAGALKTRTELVMWDVLPGDFDKKVSAAKCLERIKKHTQNGSIIVLHDSQKCGDKVLEFLPDAIEWLQTSGWKLEGL